MNLTPFDAIKMQFSVLSEDIITLEIDRWTLEKILITGELFHNGRQMDVKKISCISTGGVLEIASSLNYDRKKNRIFYF